MSMPSPDKYPSYWWWVGHVFFGMITGLVCYVVWKDENPKAAKKHLIHSIWVGCVAPVVFLVAFIVLLAIDPMGLGEDVASV